MTAISRSYRIEMGIARPDHLDERQGQQVIDYWLGAIQSDLAHVLSVAGPAAERAAAISAVAGPWLADARSRASGDVAACRLVGFRVLLFSEFDQRGDVLAEVDVLGDNGQR